MKSIEMQLSIFPTRLEIDVGNGHVVIIVHLRRALEDEATLMDVRMLHYPKVAYRPELQDDARTWIWNGNNAKAKMLADKSLHALIGILKLSNNKKSNSRSRFRRALLTALGEELLEVEETPGLEVKKQQSV